MSMAPPDSCGRTFRYTSIACEILIFALVGWLVGPYLFGPNGDVLGMLIGAIIGTLMMLLTLCYLAGLFGRKREERE
jgi:hypothetical protein